jgi:uncharacterized membrane protein YozB (DUF420 family)
MATVPFASGADRDEARFFFTMGCLMAATIVAGFSFNIIAGRSTFASPLLLHFHAFVMMAWLAIYLTQNALIFADNVTLHRRLGWIAVVWVPLMVVTGMLVTRYSLQALGGPPFFDQNQFLISNPLQLLGFAGLVGWAVTVRRNTGWHRRLMFCAFALLVGPGVGRLLPMPFFIPYAWYVSIFLPLLFPMIGVLADKRRYGKAHPAWFWGIGIVVALQIVADLIAYSPVGYAITEQVLAGTPGAERQMEAFVPD